MHMRCICVARRQKQEDCQADLPALVTEIKPKLKWIVSLKITLDRISTVSVLVFPFQSVRRIPNCANNDFLHELQWMVLALSDSEIVKNGVILNNYGWRITTVPQKNRSIRTVHLLEFGETFSAQGGLIINTHRYMSTQTQRRFW